MLDLGILITSLIGNLILGGIIFRAKSTSKSNQLFVGFIVITSLWLIINHYSYVTTDYASTLIAIRGVICFAAAQIYLLFLFVHTFPYTTIRLKKPILISLTLYTLLVMLDALSPYLFTDVIGRNPKPGPGIVLFIIQALGMLAAITYILIKKTRNSRGTTRGQLKYLSFGIITTFLLVLIGNLLSVLLFNNTSFILLTPLYTLILIAATTYAIAAHHLFDVRLIIKRTLIFSTLLLFVLGSYSMIVFFFTTLLDSQNASTAFQIKAIIPNLAAAGIIAFGFQPLRKLLQETTDKFLFQKEYQEQQVLQSLAKNLNDVVALDEALEIMMQTIVKVLHLHHAATFVFQPAENNQMAIKRIKQIGYSSTTHLFMHEDDFCIPFFTANPKILSVDDFKQEIDDEKVDIERLGKQSSRHQNPEASQLIRQHAIKQAVLKKLQSLEASLVIPLHLDATPLGLIILSEKLAGNVFTTEDMNLLETIGAQAIASIQKAKLYEGDQMKSEFVSIASHELLTPISAIEGYLSMILDENIGHVDKQAREYLSKVYTSSRRLSQLIKDLLSVSRIESGKLKIDLQSLDMEKMINDTLDQLKFVASDKNLHIEYLKPKSPLPPVWADPDRVMQVLVNLVSNAIKYTPKGSVTITASVIHHPQPLVKVDVTDTGMGMSKQAQSHLFEKFYRVDSPETTGIVGTGLGLYITKSIVEKMGGTILLKSEPGKGSTFSFTTPLFKVDNSSIS